MKLRTSLCWISEGNDFLIKMFITIIGIQKTQISLLLYMRYLQGFCLLISRKQIDNDMKHL